MSRGFLCTLFGLGMTVFSWFGPWEWPAWPAFGALHLVFGKGGGFSELPFNERAAIVVVLIVVNSGTWALIAAGLAKVLSAIMKRSRQIERPAS